MFNLLRRIKAKDDRAKTLVKQAVDSNAQIIKEAKVRSARNSRQADKAVKRVYDVAEKVFIATGQSK